MNIDKIETCAHEAKTMATDKIKPQPTVAEYLESQRPMLEKTGAKMVTVESLVKFMEG